MSFFHPAGSEHPVNTKSLNTVVVIIIGFMMVRIMQQQIHSHVKLDTTASTDSGDVSSLQVVTKSLNQF